MARTPMAKNLALGVCYVKCNIPKEKFGKASESKLGVDPIARAWLQQFRARRLHESCATRHSSYGAISLAPGGFSGNIALSAGQTLPRAARLFRQRRDRPLRSRRAEPGRAADRRR